MRGNIGVLSILVGGLAVRLLLSHTLTFFHDFYTFQFWSLDLVKSGFSGFYLQVKTDYLPGYLYVLMFVGKVFYWFLNHGQLLDMQLVYKAPSILADLINSWLIYLIAQKFLSPKKSFWTLILAVFNPSLIANSTLWGQVDSLVSLFLLLSLLSLLKQKYEMSALALGIAQAIKPVAVLVIPAYLVWAYVHHVPFRRLILSAVIFFLIFLSAFIPFYSHGEFITFVWERLMITTGYYPILSFNAFNFWGLVTVLISPVWVNFPDTTRFLFLSLQYWGYLVCAVAMVSLLYLFKKALANTDQKVRTFSLVFFLSLIYFIFFLFFTRLHERHFYYSLIYLNTVIFYFTGWRKKILVSLPFVIYLINLYFSYSRIYLRAFQLPSIILYISPLLLVISFIFLVYFFHAQVKKNHS